MKKNLILTILVLVLVSAQAQNWQNDFQTAKDISASENKPIILVFSGSDWCAPCMKLEKEIWSTEEFISYSDEHYVMLKADFPKKSKNTLKAEKEEENKQLAAVYNTSGFFPLVVILDKNGKVLGSLGYQKVSPKEYIGLINTKLK
ncbi:MAG: thioredoxin disulfide [Bacteroidetes bacterium]|nr:MAG: thioredoxin disulfide [Bacteroidota bacterium]